MDSVVVHVALLPLSSNMWRRVAAVTRGDGLVQLLGPVPFNETWQFAPGEYVEYESRPTPEDAERLVATRSVSRDPGFGRRRRVYAVCGAVVGVPLGALYTLKFLTFYFPVVCAGGVAGSILFAYASVRWGDRAWFSALRPIARNWLGPRPL